LLASFFFFELGHPREAIGASDGLKNFTPWHHFQDGSNWILDVIVYGAFPHHCYIPLVCPTALLEYAVSME